MKTHTRFSHVTGHLSLVMCLLSLLLIATAPAWPQTTESATTSGGGNWTANTTWTCSPALSPCVPNNGAPAGDNYDVGINGGSVLLNSSSSITTVTIDSLSIGSAGLGVQDAHTLTVTGNVTNGGSLSVDSGGGGGGTLNIGGSLTNSGFLNVGYGGSGGSTLNVGGNLTSSNYIQIGNSDANSANTVTAGGMFDNTGRLFIVGGDAAGAQMQLNVNGPAPSVLTGGFDLQGNAGGAVVEYGSGAITQIGNGSSKPGGALLNGANAYMEVGPTNSNSALATLATIGPGGSLELDDGATVTTTGNLAVTGTFGNSGALYLDYFHSTGGSTLNVGGSLSNSGFIQIGAPTPGASSPSTINVAGDFDNGSGSYLAIYGGSSPVAASVLKAGGAAPSILTGNVLVQGETGAAALEYGSGAITRIGDGNVNSANVTLDGSNAYIEIGATNSNSAFSGLKTIASNAYLSLNDGAMVVTAGSLMNNGNVLMDIPGSGRPVHGGSSLDVGGNLTNPGSLELSTDTVIVNGSLDNTGGALILFGGNQPTSTSFVHVTGAAPATLTGTYTLEGGPLSGPEPPYSGGGAVVEFGSGGVTAIGNGTSAGSLFIGGSNTYFEIGGTNSNSALSGLSTIASDGQLELSGGASVTTAGSLGNAGRLFLNSIGGGDTLNVGGNLTNSGSFYIGDGFNSATAIVNGVFDNTGGQVSMQGGNAPSVPSLLKVSGPAPSTLTGSFTLQGGPTGAVVEYGSGGITQIGDGATQAATVEIDGSNAFMEVGSTNSNSGLSSLTSIAKNGQLYMNDGATVTTTGALTNSGYLVVSNFGVAGSKLTVGGNMMNTGSILIGNNSFESPASVTVAGSFANSGSVEIVGDTRGGGSTHLNVANSASNSGTMYVDTGAILDVTGNNSSYTQTAGTTELFGGSLNASSVILSGGTLQGNGTITGNLEVVGGTLQALSPNSLNISGGYLQAAGTTAVQLNGTATGEYGVINVTKGPVALLGGNLNATGGVTLASGQMWKVVTLPAGSLAGLYGALQVNGGAASANPAHLNLTGGLTLDVNYNNSAGNIQLAVVATPSSTADAWTDDANTWSTAADWTNGVPLSYSDVAIGNTANGDVTLNQDATVNSLTINSGNTLEWQSGSNFGLTVGQTLSINGTLNEEAPGELSVGGAVTNSGTVNIANGGAALFSVLNPSGGLTNTGAINVDTTGTGGSGVEIGGTLANSGTVTIGNPAATALTLVTAAGLSNAGSITINSGALALNGASGTYDNASNGTITLAGTGVVVGVSGSETLTNEGTISGAGAIGNLSLVNSGLITATGAPSGSVLVIVPNASQSANGITNNAGGTLAATAGNALGIDLSQPAAGGFTGLDNEGAITVAAAGGLVIADTSANSFALITNNGTITLGDSSGPGILVLSDGGSGSAFDFQSSTTTGAITLVNNSSIVGAAGDEFLVNDLGHTIQGSGSISNLQFENDGTLIPQGVLTVAPNSSGFTTTGTITVGLGDTLAVTGPNASLTQTDGVTSVNGTLISPSVNVSGGTLEGSGTIQGNVSQTGGAIQPGDAPGTLAVTGNLTLTNADFFEEIAGATPGTGYSVLDVTGNLSLLASDTLIPLDESNFTPMNGETFDIINAGSITGMFSNDDIPFAGGLFAVSYNPTSVQLTWSASTKPPVPEPASFLLLGTGLLVLAVTARRKLATTA